MAEGGAPLPVSSAARARLFPHRCRPASSPPLSPPPARGGARCRRRAVAAAGGGAARRRIQGAGHGLSAGRDPAPARGRVCAAEHTSEFGGTVAMGPAPVMFRLGHVVRRRAGIVPGQTRSAIYARSIRRWFVSSPALFFEPSPLHQCANQVVAYQDRAHYSLVCWHEFSSWPRLRLVRPRGGRAAPPPPACAPGCGGRSSSRRMRCPARPKAAAAHQALHPPNQGTPHACRSGQPYRPTAPQASRKSRFAWPRGRAGTGHRARGRYHSLPPAGA